MKKKKKNTEKLRQKRKRKQEKNQQEKKAMWKYVKKHLPRLQSEGWRERIKYDLV